MADTTLRPVQNAFETTLIQDLNTTDLLFYCADVPDATIPSGKKVAIVLSAETTNQEIVLVESFDTGANTMTIATDGRSQNLGNGLAGTANQHVVGAKVIISDDYATLDDYGDAIDSKVNVEGDTMTGALAFSGTTQAGIKPIRLTTAQRVALVLGASDSAVVFDTDTGTYWGWDGSSWNEFSEGTAVPNASTSVPGISLLSTQTALDDGDDDNGSGVPYVLQPSQINPSNLSNSKTTPVSGDVLQLSDSEDSDAIKKITYGNLTSPFTQKSTLTAKGSIYAASADSTPTELAAGSNGQHIIYDSAETSGLKAVTAFACGQSNRINAEGTGNQDINHGLSGSPSFIQIFYVKGNGNNNSFPTGMGCATGTGNQSCTTNVSSNDTTAIIQSSSSIIKTTADDGTTNTGEAALSLIDSTKFRLNWTTAVSALGTGRINFQWIAYL